MIISNNFVPSAEIFKTGIQTLDTKDKKDDKVVDGIGSFADVLQKNLNEINDQQISANKLSDSFVKGEDVQISDVMLSSEEAKVSLEFAVQVRNKLVDAYKELSQMQL